MSNPDSSICSFCGQGEEGRKVIQCEKCRDAFHAECIKVTEAHARHITKYECEKCSADGVQVFEYDMRNVIASSSRKSMSDRGKRVAAKGVRSVKSKLSRKQTFRATKALGEPAEHRPEEVRVHIGYQYYRVKNGGKAAFWNCCKRDSGCEARLATSLMSGRVITQLGKHIHPPAESQGGAASTVRACTSPPSTNASKGRGIRRPHKGYVFMRDHRPKERAKLYWCCQEKYRARCTARIHTSAASGEVVLEVGEHSHSRQGLTKTESSGKSTKRTKPARRSSSTSHDIETPSKHWPAGPGFRHKGYAYNREQQSADGTKQFWYCKARKTVLKCPARIHTSAASGEVLEELNEHNHPPVGPLKTELVQRPPVAEHNVRHKGFVYYRDMLSSDRTKRYWYCCLKSKLYCPARVHTLVESGEVVRESGEHTHPPVDAVHEKDPDGSLKGSPKSGRLAKRRHTLNTGGRSGLEMSKKRRASCAVDINNNSPQDNASPPLSDRSKPNTPSIVNVVQRLMGLPDTKRAFAASLVASLLDEIENASEWS